MQGWTPDRPVEVVTPNRTVRCGPAAGQDPGTLLDELAVFTPAEADIDE